MSVPGTFPTVGQHSRILVIHFKLLYFAKHPYQGHKILSKGRRGQVTSKATCLPEAESGFEQSEEYVGR